MKSDSSVHEFTLAVVAEGPGFVVARYVLSRGGGPPAIPVVAPPGSTSDGYFWAGRRYSIYRMKDPRGALIAHRFDAVATVEITPESVTYHDDVVDWWVYPDGTVVEEDADELAEFVERGLISAERAGRILADARRAQSQAASIVRELEGIEREFGFA